MRDTPHTLFQYPYFGQGQTCQTHRNPNAHYHWASRLSFTQVGDARPHPQIRHPASHGLSHDSTPPSVAPRPPTVPSSAPAQSKPFRPTFRSREGHSEAKVLRKSHSPAPPKNRGSIQPPAGDLPEPRGRTTLPRIRHGAGTKPPQPPPPQECAVWPERSWPALPSPSEGAFGITYSGPWRITSVAPGFTLFLLQTMLTKHVRGQERSTPFCLTPR